ncbi:MAG: glutamate-5-semialdehyde dehydrogenase [archaeon]|nr:glutamate-5-semialdehyde dehydrogenase [archaeon]
MDEEVMDEEVINKAKLIKQASYKAALLSSEDRVRILEAMAAAIGKNREKIKTINSIDIKDGKMKGLTEAMIDRLILNDKRIDEMIKGLKEVAAMKDELGSIVEMNKRPNGLLIGKMIVPIGVISIIYESRPNVTVDATGLCVKSGNTILLRGGSEAINSNIILTEIIREAAEKNGFPKGGIQIIEKTDRNAVETLFQLRQYVDVLIPRGNAKFIQHVVTNSSIPVIETGAGNCHSYVDKFADLEMAVEIVFNGKVQRPSVCNATKKVLIHEKVAQEFIPKMKKKLEEAGVIFLVCEKSKSYFPDSKLMPPELWYEEFLDMRLGIKIVDSIDEAIDHINEYNSKHTEAIITEDYTRAMKFINSIDAAALNWNASTRFTDGSQYGIGAEIGISTQKIHARGPMSVNELTTKKYVVFGEGQIRK